MPLDRHWAPLARTTCRYGALANQRLGPRTSPCSPPGWTERPPSFTSNYDSTSSRVLSSDRTGASQLSSPRTSSAAWPTMLGHPLSPITSRHSYAPPAAAHLQSAAAGQGYSPTRPRTPCSPRTPRALQVWLGDLDDQPWHGRSDKARSRSLASRASRSSTLSPSPSHGVSLKSASPLRVSLSGTVETFVETPRLFATPVATQHPLPMTSRHWYVDEKKERSGPPTPRTEHLYLDRTTEHLYLDRTRRSLGATPALLPYTALDSARALLTVLKSPPVRVALRAY